jgi:glycosyltransferase involved in cell wall biosynthesis
MLARPTMRISIVTICYNHAEFVEQAMLSVLEQRGVELEYIVVDDGSTDGSREVMERYRHRLSHLIFQSNQGPAAALNHGFARATGEVYGYLNSDDLLMPGALAAACRLLGSEPGLDVISGHGYATDRDAVTLHRIFSHKFDSTAYALGCCVIIQPSTFFRARMFRAVGGFNPANRLNWDGELMLDFALAGATFRVVPQFWSRYRVYPETITGRRRKDNSRYISEFLRIADKTGIRFSPAKRRAMRIRQWLRQPHTLALRIIDGIRHPLRVV